MESKNKSAYFTIKKHYGRNARGMWCIVHSVESTDGSSIFMGSHVSASNILAAITLGVDPQEAARAEKDAESLRHRKLRAGAKIIALSDGND